MASHFNWGAAIWITGVLVWSWFVLPKLLQVENEQPIQTA
jgi:hypothetical protein